MRRQPTIKNHSTVCTIRLLFPCSSQVQLRNLKQSYNELKSYNAVRGPAAAAQQNTTGVIGQQADRDELYKNRPSWKTDSQ